jgi:hypothetical protein
LGNEFRLSRVIDKTSLNGIPARAKVFGRIRQKERRELLVFIPRVGGLIFDHWFFAISINLSLCSRYLRGGCQICRSETFFPPALRL